MATADDLLTALARTPLAQRGAMLNRMPLAVLRAAADLCGASYADAMGRREAVAEILANF